MKTNSTIIFCHYGYSKYLYYTLKQLKHSNSHARIALIGDQYNFKIAKKTCVEHINFDRLSDTSEINQFDRVYQHVAGTNHGKKFWTKFVFKRWFYIHAFLKKEKVENFWHFDSDNMILTDLSNQEQKFSSYECTEQCNGSCMNGYINSSNIVEKYVRKINELFCDTDYINKQKEAFILNPNFAFTEMRAFETFKVSERINTVRLNSIIGDESFDDCICQSHNYERYENPVNGQYIKKLYFNKFNRHFYCYHNPTKKLIKMNSLNLSWVPIYFFENILMINTYSSYKRKYFLGEENGLQVLNLTYNPLLKKIIRNIKKL